MHKLKQALTGVTLALIACGSLSLPAHAAPHGGGGFGGGGPRGGGGGWPGYYGAGAAMGAAAASASYRAAPEVYNATGNNAPEDDSVYDKDLSTLLAPAQPQPGPQGNGQPAPQRPPASCPKGQVYNDLTESCDRP